MTDTPIFRILRELSPEASPVVLTNLYTIILVTLTKGAKKTDVTAVIENDFTSIALIVTIAKKLLSMVPNPPPPSLDLYLLRQMQNEAKKVIDESTALAKTIDSELGPNCNEVCRDPLCGKRTVYFQQVDTRGGDEASTEFFTCLTCGKTWRGRR